MDEKGIHKQRFSRGRRSRGNLVILLTFSDQTFLDQSLSQNVNEVRMCSSQPSTGKCEIFSGVSSLTPPGASWYLLRWRWPRWPRMALWAGGMTSAELVAGLWRKQQRESTLWSSSQLSLPTQGCIGAWWVCTPEEETPDSLCPQHSPSGRRESPSTWRQKVRLYSHTWAEITGMLQFKP